jgi:hypothetical protein
MRSLVKSSSRHSNKLSIDKFEIAPSAVNWKVSSADNGVSDDDCLFVITGSLVTGFSTTRTVSTNVVKL